jgi:two-component system nitrogen regulation response regulator NtrX
MSDGIKNGESCLALIVDDEESIRKTLADVFEDEGWQSVTAENGKVGLQLFTKRQPDLVLLDVWMPGMDGSKPFKKCGS